MSLEGLSLMGAASSVVVETVGSWLSRRLSSLSGPSPLLPSTAGRGQVGTASRAALWGPDRHSPLFTLSIRVSHKASLPISGAEEETPAWHTCTVGRHWGHLYGLTHHESFDALSRPVGTVGLDTLGPVD